MVLHLQTELTGDLHAPSAARSFLASAFQEPDAAVFQTLVCEAELVVSELVTNSVRACSTHVELGIHFEQSSMTISVQDDAEGWPTVSSPDPLAASGRGLHIVSAIATGWGVEPAQGRGKIVWATLSPSSTNAA
jgi:two-component sensor histidine kinase